MIWTNATTIEKFSRSNMTFDRLRAAIHHWSYRDVRHIEWLQQFLYIGAAQSVTGDLDWIWLEQRKTRLLDAYNHKLVEDFPAFTFVREVSTPTKMSAFHCFIHQDQWGILRLVVDQFMAEWLKG